MAISALKRGSDFLRGGPSKLCQSSIIEIKLVEELIKEDGGTCEGSLIPKVKYDLGKFLTAISHCFNLKHLDLSKVNYWNYNPNRPTLDDVER